VHITTWAFCVQRLLKPRSKEELFLLSLTGNVLSDVCGCDSSTYGTLPEALAQMGSDLVTFEGPNSPPGPTGWDEAMPPPNLKYPFQGLSCEPGTCT
jgi:hypothetical protein